MYGHAQIFDVKSAQIYQHIYQKSLQLQDYKTAIYAVNYLVLNNPVKYNNWLDTLDLTYFLNREYSQSLRLADTLLSNRGFNDMRMELKAASAKELGQNTEALMAYTILFNKTKRPKYGFEELNLEYNSELFEEALSTAENLKIAIEVFKDSSLVNIEISDPKAILNIPILAATFNICGEIFLILRKKENAIQQFKEALEVCPDFELAKKNLEITSRNSN